MALAPVERAADRRAARLKDRNAPTLHDALLPALRRDAALCSDADGAFATVARAHGATRHDIPAKRGPRALEGAFHMQTVNNRCADHKDFPRLFRGTATRYRDGYLTWLTAPRRTDDPWKAIIAA